MLAPSTTRRVLDAFADGFVSPPSTETPGADVLGVLTARELEVFTEMAAGSTNKAIAQRLHPVGDHGQDPCCPGPGQARPPRPHASGDLRLRAGYQAASVVTAPAARRSCVRPTAARSPRGGAAGVTVKGSA